MKAEPRPATQIELEWIVYLLLYNTTVNKHAALLSLRLCCRLQEELFGSRDRFKINMFISWAFFAWRLEFV